MAEKPPKKYSSDRSERARQLVAEGRFGGREHGSKGGRPRKVRDATGTAGTASAHVARAARKDAPLILKVFEDAVKSGQLPHHRLAAVKAWIATEDREADREERAIARGDRASEIDALRQLSKEELVEQVASKLRSNPALLTALGMRSDAPD